jgi:hypothetical protein
MRNELDLFVATHWTTMLLLFSIIVFCGLSVGFGVWIWRDAVEQAAEMGTY